MNPKLPVLKPKRVIQVLEKKGFYIHHQTGSHVQLRHPAKSELRITVPYHNKDLPRAVIRSIVRQAAITVEEFNELLSGKSD